MAKEEKPREVKLAGYAKGKGTMVHVIIDDIFALCTRNQKAPRVLEVEDSLTLKDVSCARCKRLAFYKTLLEQEKQEEQEKQGGEEIEVPPLADSISIESIDKPVETENIEEETENIEEEIEEKKDWIEFKGAVENCNSEAPLQAQLDRIVNTLVNNPNAHFKGLWRTSKRYSIFHTASDIEMFFNVDKDAIVYCLFFLNSIPNHWNGQGDIPREYLYLCNKLFRLGYHSSDMRLATIAQLAIKEKEKNEQKKEQEEKPQVKIAKKPSGKITRREKPKTKISRRNAAKITRR